MEGIEDKRVLIIEDNALIGAMIADAIVEAGGRPVGPALSEREALGLIEHNQDMPDVAVLDLGLDVKGFRVAAKLLEHGIPFVFATGSAGDIPAIFSDVPICSKPYTPNDLIRALSGTMRPFS